MRRRTAARYFVLPSCLLVLNVVNQVAQYYAERSPLPSLARTFLVIVLVLFGSGVVAFLVSPWLETALMAAHKRSRDHGGTVMEWTVIGVVTVAIFAVYWRMTVAGTEGLLLPEWRLPEPPE